MTMTTPINTRPRTNAKNGAQVRRSSSSGAAYKVLHNIYVRVVPLGLRERIWAARHRRKLAIARRGMPATPTPGSLEARYRHPCPMRYWRCGLISCARSPRRSIGAALSRRRLPVSIRRRALI